MSSLVRTHSMYVIMVGWSWNVHLINQFQCRMGTVYPRKLDVQLQLQLSIFLRQIPFELKSFGLKIKRIISQQKLFFCAWITCNYRLVISMKYSQTHLKRILFQEFSLWDTFPLVSQCTSHFGTLRALNSNWKLMKWKYNLDV